MFRLNGDSLPKGACNSEGCYNVGTLILVTRDYSCILRAKAHKHLMNEPSNPKLSIRPLRISSRFPNEPRLKISIIPSPICLRFL